jgi:DNA-directed RNA polymerase specialized sigma24 family protein
MNTQNVESYDLFRRAIVNRDAEAWATVHGRYRPMLISWASQAGAGGEHGLDCGEIADHAFARAWLALSPQRFADFPTLARLLGYLRACVRTAAIDGRRQHSNRDHDLPEAYADARGTPEQVVLAEIERTALWEIALAMAATLAERVALVESFAYDLPPRAIYERHPQLFPNVGEVYRAKRNLIDRLQRNHELRGLYPERMEA